MDIVIRWNEEIWREECWTGAGWSTDPGKAVLLEPEEARRTAAAVGGTPEDEDRIFGPE